jgi:predicted Zn-dependent protease
VPLSRATPGAIFHFPISIFPFAFSDLPPLCHFRNGQAQQNQGLTASFHKNRTLQITSFLVSSLQALIRRTLRSLPTRCAPVLIFLIFLAAALAPALLAQSEDLAAKSQRAKEFMAEGKFADAVPLYRELNQAVPNNPGLLLNLGMALQMAGDERKSIPQLEAAVKLDPQLTPAWLFLGTARVHTGQPQSGIEALKAALRLQPDQKDAREMLAGTLLSLDRAGEAAEQYQKLAEQNSASPASWYGLGRSYEALANRAFDELQKTAPESAYWLALIAETRLREQQYSGAFFLYKSALQKAPAMPGLHAAVAEIYRRTGHTDWAGVEEERERQLPAPDCVVQKLECDFRDGKFTELTAGSRAAKTPERNYWASRAYNELALQAFTRLGELPPSAEQHELKAHIYTGQKKYSEAAEEWKQALKFLPGDKQIEKQLAISLKFAQNYSEALPLFQELLRMQPSSPDLNYLTGETLLDLQRVEESIPLLRAAVLRDLKLVPAHKALARAYLAAGKSAAAIPHLKAALATDEDGSLHYQLARAYQSSGQAELSQKVLAEYQKLQRSSSESKQSALQEVEITPP